MQQIHVTYTILIKNIEKSMARKWLLTGLILSITLICGIILGTYFHTSILSSITNIFHITPPMRHYCPSPPFANQSSPFVEDQLAWHVEAQIWKAPQEISFMQALIKDNNALVCYYRWPNPQEKGTYLWLTVELSLNADQIIKPAGLKWKNELNDNTNVSLCTSGIQSCPFSLSPE